MSRVRVTDNTPNVINQTTKNSSVFVRLMLEEVDKRAYPNTPKKTQRLSRDILKQTLGTKGKIAWRKEYAIFQENKQFRNYTTPGTGPHFAERAVLSAIQGTGFIATKAYK